MRKKILIAHSLWLLTLLMPITGFLFSCKKTDVDVKSMNVVDRFFKVPDNADTAIIRIIEDLKAKNEEHPFVEAFVANEGYPLWEYSKVKTKKVKNSILAKEDEDEVIDVPVVLDGASFVKDILSTKLSSDILYKLFKGDEYGSYGFDKDPNRETPNADDIVAKIMAFEHDIWGQEFFKVNDNRLFNYWPLGQVRPQTFFVSQRMINVTVEISWVCGFTTGGQLTGCPPGVDHCWELVPIHCENHWTVMVDDGTEEGGGWTTTPPNEGGGGGGGGGGGTIPTSCTSGAAWVRLVPNSETGVWEDPCTNQPAVMDYATYMNSINTWTALNNLNNNLGYVGYGTENLRSHGRGRGWDVGVPALEFNRRCGRAFEISALEFFDMPPNCYSEDAPERGLRNGGAVSRVKPDAHTAAFYYKYEGEYVQPTLIPLGDYICTEVKAVNGTLRLSDNRWQILGELELLSRAKAAMNNPEVPSSVKPVLFLVTTSNTIIDQSIIDEANARGIMVWQSKATYDPLNCCKLSYTPPVMLNFTANPGIDIAPKSFIGATGLFASPQILLEPTPDCDTDDPETIE